MKFVIILSTLSILINSCNKETPQDPTKPNNYNFSDLSPSENLLDSILILNPFNQYFKFYYQSKVRISNIERKDPFSFSDRVIIDTLVYENSKLSRYISYAGEKLNIFKVINENNNPIRIYIYEDDYNVSYLRQLGTYITYSGSLPIRVNSKFINSSLLRDSIVLNIKRNINGNIDSIYEQLNNNFSNYGTLRFKVNYTNIPNKLNQNANLKGLNYFSVLSTLFNFTPIQFDFNNIDPYNNNIIQFPLLNSIFSDILFNSTILPSNFIYKEGNRDYSYHFKYTFNENNYISSYSLGSSPTFNEITNQKAKFTYYKRR